MRVDKVEFGEAMVATDPRRGTTFLSNKRDIPERDEIIRSAFGSEEGWVALAQAITEPISVALDYRSRLRSVMCDSHDAYLTGNYLQISMDGTPSLERHHDDAGNHKIIQIHSRVVRMSSLLANPWAIMDDVQAGLAQSVLGAENGILNTVMALLTNVTLDEDSDFTDFLRPKHKGIVLISSTSRAMRLCGDLGIVTRPIESVECDGRVNMDGHPSIMTFDGPHAIYLPSFLGTLRVEEQTVKIDHLNVHEGMEHVAIRFTLSMSYIIEVDDWISVYRSDPSRLP